MEVCFASLSGIHFTLICPFPNTWNYLVDAVAVRLGVPVTSVILVYDCKRIVFDSSVKDEQRVSFGEVLPKVIFLVKGYKI